MFTIFEYTPNKAKLEKSIQQLDDPSDRDFYQTLLEKYSGGKNGIYFNIEQLEDNRYQEGFYEKWDEFHFKKLNQQLVKKIEEVQPDKILFFIHGFNVPHALAAVQSIELMDKHIRAIDKDSKVLLVPIFWPSNDGKKFNDKLSDRKLENIKRWLYYSNRAYFAGLGLRKVIVDLEDANLALPQLYVFAHSLGTTAASTLFINTTSKLQTDFQSSIQNNLCASEHPVNIAAPFALQMEKSENANYKIIQKFNAIRLPKSPLRIFLNAAAIPGRGTFMDMCEDHKKKVAIFVGINPKDVTLKKVIGAPRILGATTLGLDKDGDAQDVKNNLFKTGHFIISSPYMSHKQHNVFNYMAEEGFQDLLRDFFLFEFP